jgi:hypothetical protein
MICSSVVCPPARSQSRPRLDLGANVAQALEQPGRAEQGKRGRPGAGLQLSRAARRPGLTCWCLARCRTTLLSALLPCPIRDGPPYFCTLVAAAAFFLLQRQRSRCLLEEALTEQICDPLHEPRPCAVSCSSSSALGAWPRCLLFFSFHRASGRCTCLEILGESGSRVLGTRRVFSDAFGGTPSRTWLRGLGFLISRSGPRSRCGATRVGFSPPLASVDDIVSAR